MASKTVRSVKTIQATSKYDLFNQLLLVVIAVTVTTIPFIFDSFTASKLFVLAIGLTLISIRLFLDKDVAQAVKIPKVLTILMSLLLLSIILSWFMSGVPFTRGLIGQFGRGNGVLYYFSVILIFAFSLKTFRTSSGHRMHQLLTLLSWFMALYAALQYIGIDIAKLDTKGISPVVLTFGNSNFAGGMLAVLFSYQLTYTVIARFYRPSQIGLLLGLLISSTFAAAVQGYLIILFSIILVVTVILAKRYPSNWVRRSLIAAWVIGLVSIILGVFGKFVFAGVFSRATFQIRIEYWNIALNVIKDFPLFGVGPDKLYDVSSNYMAPGTLKIITTTRLDNAHNWYLNFGVNYGLVALFLLLGIFVWVFLASSRLLKNLESSNAIAISSLVAFVAMFIDGLVSLEQPGIGVWLYLFAGVVAGASIDSLRKSSEVESTKNSVPGNSFSKFNVAVISLALIFLFSSIVLGNRIAIDGILRSNIQTALLDKGTEKTFSAIESAAVKLYSDPEYAAQALKPLAAIGAGAKLDSVSQSFYDYYPNSIQATLIRADVLRALNRMGESCPLRTTLIKNSPWDPEQLIKYINCHMDGYLAPDLVRNLTIASRYFGEIDRGVILEDVNEAINLSNRLVVVSNRARSLFILGQIESARDLQTYGNTLLSRLNELQATNPTLVSEVETKYLKKLLDFK
jgi:O-antigen ligase